ncbi:MAG: DUF3078 domain-containing protein [Paludibacteraceae bacterium]|nr:DUF3078 domain-containing protein [Paludibacteraceae bacterium]
MIFLLLLMLSAFGQQAADTVYTVRTDTLRKQQAEVAGLNEADLLLDMIARQSRDLYVKDSLQRDSLEKREAFVHDSLVQVLKERESQLRAMLQSVNDSLDILLAAERAQKAYEDSLRRDAYMRDSVAKEITAQQGVQTLELTPSIVKDKQEDAEELKRLKKNIFSPWRTDALVQIQFAENYTSENWYQGGNKFNFNLLMLAKGNVVYTKNNILWESLGEWRTGVANSPGDTLREYNVTDDLFRLYSKFGYQVFKNLYVSSSAEFKTSLWSVWNTNAQTVKTAFLTPIRFNLDLGLDYKPVKGLSIMFSPLSYKMIYALYSDERVNVKSFGIEEGKNILNDVGSSLRVKWKWQPLREIALETEFYLYTNYKRVEIDWQTDCNFIINRFLSARLSLHPRYDNTVILAGDEKAKIQYKEMLSIGFSHKFN